MPAGLTEQGLGMPGSASAPVPPLDQLAADEVAATAAIGSVTVDVANLTAEGVSTSALTAASASLTSTEATTVTDTTALTTQVETT